MHNFHHHSYVYSNNVYNKPLIIRIRNIFKDKNNAEINPEKLLFKKCFGYTNQ